MRDQLLLVGGSYLFVFLVCLPWMFFLKLFFGISIWDLLWSVFFGKSLFFTICRTILFPLSFKLISPAFATQVCFQKKKIENFDFIFRIFNQTLPLFFNSKSFFAVLDDVNKDLSNVLKKAPNVSLWTWLAVSLKRALPLLLVGAIVWILAMLPRIGTVVVVIAKFLYLCRLIEPKLAGVCLLMMLVGGQLGALLFQTFVGTRSLSNELCEYYSIRFALLNGSTYDDACRQRRQLVKRQLPLLLGFTLPFWLVMAFVPGGAAIYSLTPGIAFIIYFWKKKTNKKKLCNNNKTFKLIRLLCCFDKCFAWKRTTISFKTEMNVLFKYNIYFCRKHFNSTIHRELWGAWRQARAQWCVFQTDAWQTIPIDVCRNDIVDQVVLTNVLSIRRDDRYILLCWRGCSVMDLHTKRDMMADSQILEFLNWSIEKKENYEKEKTFWNK